MKKLRGRPPKNLIIPHPLKSGEWLQVGAYDKHWPAVNWAWCKIREGVSRKKAMSDAAEKFNVEESSLWEWVRRARRRGPIAEHDYPDEDDFTN